MKYHTTTEKNNLDESQKHTLSERSQTQKAMYHMLHLHEILEMGNLIFPRKQISGFPELGEDWLQRGRGEIFEVIKMFYMLIVW